jgi:hypothetical protein
VRWSGSWLVLWRALVLLSLAEPTADLVGQLLRLRVPRVKNLLSSVAGGARRRSLENRRVAARGRATFSGRQAIVSPALTFAAGLVLAVVPVAGCSNSSSTSDGSTEGGRGGVSAGSSGSVAGNGAMGGSGGATGGSGGKGSGGAGGNNVQTYSCGSDTCAVGQSTSTMKMWRVVPRQRRAAWLSS